LAGFKARFMKAVDTQASNGNNTETERKQPDIIDDFRRCVRSLVVDKSLHRPFFRVLREEASELLGELTRISKQSENEKDLLSQSPDGEPSENGREIVGKEKIGDTWLRLEKVPCRSPRCRKKPDLHGPYWYSYRWAKGRWRAKYHGRNRPDIFPRYSLDDAQRILDECSGLDGFSDEKTTELRRIIADMSRQSGDVALALRAKASRLLSEIHERYEYLVDKALSGEALTADERESMTHLSGLLAGDH
jgi:hypothetical protein